MMKCVRSLGLAARFVSGYLYDTTLDTPAVSPVRNTGLQQGTRQEQAAPVSGAWFGAANDFAGMEVQVSVRRVPTPEAAAQAGMAE